MKKYWLINVSGYNGYSLVVHCEANTEDEAINIASEADLFEDSADAKFAFAEEADEDTIKHFKEWNLISEVW